MIKVIYRLQVMYEEELHTFSVEGTILAIPRKDEMVEMYTGLLFKIENIIYRNNGEFIQIDFYPMNVTYDIRFECIKKGFKSE